MKMSRIALIALTLTMLPLPARAADIAFLSEFLTTAYEAMNYTTVCMAKDTEFVARTSGPRGNAIKYAEHVKDETIASLWPEDVQLVLRSSALAAKIISLRTLRRLDGPGPQQGDARIREWCTTTARTFVKDFVTHHDNNHALIVDALKKAHE